MPLSNNICRLHNPCATAIDPGYLIGIVGINFCNYCFRDNTEVFIITRVSRPDGITITPYEFM